MLQLGRWLDVRDVASPAIADSVHIPLDELAGRVHELPRRIETIRIAGTGDEAEQARDLLRGLERPASVEAGFDWGESGRTRLWSPNRFLEEVVSEIPPGVALDIACGSGRDSVFLADCGFRTTSIDHLPDALALGRDLERRYIEGSSPISWVCADLEAEPPKGQFDLVVCFFYLNRDLLRGVADLLSPGGRLVLETFTATHREKFGKPRSENFVLQPGELRELASGLEVLTYDEDWHDGKHTARMEALKR